MSGVTESAFVERRQADWLLLDTLIRRFSKQGLKKQHPSEIARFAPLYRDVCADLARAEAARYSAALVESLEGLAENAHAVLYGAHARLSQQRGAARGSLRRAWVAFPAAVRRRYRSILLAGALFFIPLVACALVSLRNPNFAFSVVPEGMLRPLTEAYTQGFAGGRDEGTDAAMTGFYINNNIGIALRCFALGIFGGLGSAFFLVQNGISIGATLGYVTSQGAGYNIATFIVGHGSLELFAIVLAGGAGLATGFSIVVPSELTRVASLQKTAADVITIVLGASVLLLLAAMIEGFWSGSSIPPAIKHGLGGTLLVLLAAYMLLVGRDSDATKVATKGGAEVRPWT